MYAHIAESAPSPNIILPATYEWHVKCSFVLRCNCNHCNIVFNATISQESRCWQNSWHKYDPQSHAAIFNWDLSWSTRVWWNSKSKYYWLFWYLIGLLCFQKHQLVYQCVLHDCSLKPFFPIFIYLTKKV